MEKTAEKETLVNSIASKVMELFNHDQNIFRILDEPAVSDRQTVFTYQNVGLLRALREEIGKLKRLEGCDGR